MPITIIGDQWRDEHQQVELFARRVNPCQVVVGQRHHGKRGRTRELERSARELQATNKELEIEIAERKRVEQELRRSEAFLAEGELLSQVGSFSWQVATDEVKWSKQLYRIYKLEIGVPVTVGLVRTRVHRQDSSLLEKMKMIDQGRGFANDFEWQYRLVMPDNSIKYLHAVAHAIRDRDGQPEYIAAVQDVTARRLSEEASCRETESFFRRNSPTISRPLSAIAFSSSISF